VEMCKRPIRLLCQRTKGANNNVQKPLYRLGCQGTPLRASHEDMPETPRAVPTLLHTFANSAKDASAIHQVDNSLPLTADPGPPLKGYRI